MRICPSLFPSLKLAARSSVAIAALFATHDGFGQTAPQTPTLPTTRSTTTESIVVQAQKRLLKEKDSPSAVTELGAAQIGQTGIQGSVATLLRNAPSVYVYQSGIGNNEPVLSLRGTRGLETAQTLDDVPMQDLVNGGSGGYLQNILGGHFNLDQISGVSIYPGVAYPDKNTFGTIGGTISYATLRPTDQRYIDITGSVGSFGTYNEGFALNSGDLDGPLGSGDNAPKFLLKYSNLQTSGYIDYTGARYNNMLFALDKPYDDGASKVQATVLYNTANGLYSFEPVPVPYLQKYGMFSNYSPSQEFDRQQNDYLTTILKDETYVNDYLNFGLTAFYIKTDSSNLAYGNPSIFTTPGIIGSATIDGAAPLNQNPAGFGQQSGYAPGGLYYNPLLYPYNGNAAYPAGTAACPAKVSQEWTKLGLVSPCGYNALLSTVSNQTYGIQPRATVTLPEFFGIANTIKMGAMAAKETQPQSDYYAGGTPNVAQSSANQISGAAFPGANNGNTQRTIFTGYLQDRIDMLQNTLHMTPGLTLEGTNSSFSSQSVFGATPSAALLATPYCKAGNPCLYGPFKATKWDRDLLPFFNVSYDLDKILPAAHGVSLYASFGESALFAPVTDFGPNLVGGPPSASIVHMYEGGIKYNVSNITLSADYFYQKVDRDYGFFVYQSGPLSGEETYTNDGEREFKGFEAAATWQVTPQWQLFGNVSHTLAHYLVTSLAYVTVQEDQFGIVQKGDPITGVPDWLSNFGVDYNRRSLAMDQDDLNVRFQGQYTGHQYTSYDLIGTENVGPIPGISAKPGSYIYYSALQGDTTYDPHGGISPFVVFNLDANYKMPIRSFGPLKTLSFDLNVLNLFNEQYYQYYYHQIVPTSCGNFTSGPFAGKAKSLYSCTPNFADGIPGEPFAVTFTVTARF